MITVGLGWDCRLQIVEAVCSVSWIRLREMLFVLYNNCAMR